LNRWPRVFSVHQRNGTPRSAKLGKFRATVASPFEPGPRTAPPCLCGSAENGEVCLPAAQRPRHPPGACRDTCPCIQALAPGRAGLGTCHWGCRWLCKNAAAAGEGAGHSRVSFGRALHHLLAGCRPRKNVAPCNTRRKHFMHA
jgi:hypothetical protein